MRRAAMRILLAGWFRYPWYEEACARALESLGVIVTRLSWSDCFSLSWFGRLQQWFSYGPSITKMNNLLAQTTGNFRPDVTLIYNGQHISECTLWHLRSRTWLAGYTNDDPFGAHAWRLPWRKFRATIPYYHSWHVYRPENILEFKRRGARSVSLLMSYYLPWEVTGDCLNPRDTFEYDVTFVGHGEPDGRAQYVEALLDAGISLTIFGHPSRWHKCLPKRTLRRLPPIREANHEQYRRIVRRSKINLVFLSGQNRDQYTRRCFEIPAWGGFMLAPRTPVLQGLYEEGIEAEFYGGTEELVEKCRQYLGQERRETIAGQGQQRCFRSGYDVVGRMSQWLHDTCVAMES